VRILHVINSVHPREGGTAECVAQIGSFLDRSGEEVEVVTCADPPEASWVRDFPVRVHGLGPGVGRYAFSPRVLPWLRANVDRFDVVVVNGLWQYQGLAAYMAVRGKPIPYFVYAHGMLDPWSRWAAPFKYLKKIAYWSVFARHLLNDASAVLFTSELEAELATHFFPTEAWTGVVVGNGIAEPPNVKLADIRALQHRFPEIREKRVLLFLSRIHEKKGIDILLRAFSAVHASHPELHLVICGSGEAQYEAKLRQLAEHLSLHGSVTWTGLLRDAAKWAAFEVAEAFVLPSHQENFGISVVEALAMGTPVIISDKINICATIRDDGAGLVCVDHVDDLTRALVQWLGYSSSQRMLLKQRAADCFHRHYSVAGAANKVRSVMAGADIKRKVEQCA